MSLFLIMKKLFLCFLTICTISNVNANSASIEDFDIEQKKIQVLDTVKKYAEASACDTTFDEYKTTPKQVFLINKSSSGIDFFVLWGGVDGCYRSATGESWEYRISRVVINDDRFFITDSNVFGHIENGRINYADIESIKEISDQKYEIISTEYSDTDFIKDEYGYKTRYLKDNAVPKKYRFIVKIIEAGSRSIILERVKI